MILSVENLCFSYGAHQVLQHVDFAVEKGEFLSILGPNLVMASIRSLAAGLAAS